MMTCEKTTRLKVLKTRNKATTQAMIVQFKSGSASEDVATAQDKQ